MISFKNTAFVRLSSALLFVGFTGCQLQPRIEADTEALATQAAAASAPIRFLSEPGPVDATEPAPMTLTLSDAVIRALRTHPEVQASLARVRIIQSGADQARLLPNPILDVALRFPEGGGKSIIDVGLAMEMVSLLQRPGRISAADDRLRAASRDAVTTVLDVLAGVQRNYVAIQALDALIQIQGESRRLLAQVLEIAQSRLNAGEGIRLDVTVIQSQQIDLETQIAENRLQSEQARLALARLIGEPSRTTAWKIMPWQPPVRVEGTESAWITAALNERPEIQAQRYELSALGAELRLAKWFWLQGGGAGLSAERDGDWSSGPAVTIPLPVFDVGQARKAGVQARLIEAGHDLTSQQRQVVEEVRRALAASRLLSQNLSRVRGELVPLLERRREEAVSAFRTGQADITALVLAVQELQAAKARAAELEQRAASAWIDLERAAGGPGAVMKIGKSTTQPTTRP